ncbi:MAG: Signal peptidase-like protein, partial [Siphonobacter aquaeclarae]|nr:Signal peptidase-like protein [Siphonobacter aquaeclarae]
VQKGDATLQKTDIFRKIMWFGFRGEDNWYPVPIPQVLRIVELNKKGVIPPSFEELEAAPVTPQTKAPALNSDLEQMDRKYQSKNRSPKNKKKRGGGGGRPPQNNNKG